MSPPTPTDGRLAVIPAKARSERFPGKNRASLGGTPLVARAVRTAREAGVFDVVMVSTDDPEITDLARAQGADVPFLRDAALTADTVEVPEVVRHALQWYASRRPFEWVCILQPTCPLRTVADITRSWQQVAEYPDADVVISVSPFEPHPDRALVWTEGRLQPRCPQAATASRQHLQACYRPDGVVYWWRAAALLASLNPYDGKVVPYFTPPASRLDIDHPEELKYAEWRLGSG